MDILELPTPAIVLILQNCSYETVSIVSLTCKTLNNFIEAHRNLFESKRIYHIDLERRRVRAWRDFSWCDRIPFRSIEYISKFFSNVTINVLTVNKLDIELCEFLIEKCRRSNLRFEQLRLFHSFSVPHSSISQLLIASNCQVINFEAVNSNLGSGDFELEGYKHMDDTIESPFFDSILEVSNAKNFIFHGCDKMPQLFVRQLLQKWMNGSRKVDAVRITTNQNFSFDTIIENIDIKQIDKSTWKMKNVNNEEATITMRRNNFHFFMAFEVNDNHVEDILYKIPFIE